MVTAPRLGEDASMKSPYQWPGLALSLSIAVAASLTSCVEPHYAGTHRGHSVQETRYYREPQQQRYYQTQPQQRYYQTQQQTYHTDHDRYDDRRQYYTDSRSQWTAPSSGPSITIRR